MLHILLMILKIIGIALAVIIGVLLAVLVGILFIPVRYYAQADGKLGEEIPFRLEARVTWLLHAVNIVFSYSKSVCLKIKIFGFTVFDSSKKKSRTEKKRKKAERELESREDGEAKQPKKEIEDKRKENQEPVGLEENEPAGKDEEAGAEEGSEKKEVSKIRAFLEAFRLFFRKLLEAVENIEYTIQKICGKIKGVMENIRYYVNILQGEAFQRVFKNGKRQLFWILRRVMPKKCRINLTVGMEDPSGTGMIMEFYGMLYPFIGNHVSIQADFEEKVMEGDLYIKGKITAVIFLIAAIRLLADKNIWKLIKLLKEGA